MQRSSPCNKSVFFLFFTVLFLGNKPTQSSNTINSTPRTQALEIPPAAALFNLNPREKIFKNTILAKVRTFQTKWKEVQLVFAFGLRERGKFEESLFFSLVSSVHGERLPTFPCFVSHANRTSPL